MEGHQIKMAHNPREPLLTVPALEQTIGMPLSFIVPLINRDLFPRPVHMNPPLWREKSVRAWRSKVSKTA